MIPVALRSSSGGPTTAKAYRQEEPAMTEYVERLVWRDPLLRTVWVLELLEGHVVGYAGPVRSGEGSPEFDTLRFERDSGFLRGIAERFEPL